MINCHLKFFFILAISLTGCLLPNPGRAQNMSNLFFLHHSVGNGLVVDGNMRETIAAYNATSGTSYAFWDHGYNSDGLRNSSGEATGTNYEIPDDNTDPDGLYYLWTSAEAQYAACRGKIIASHQVIAFKSCYPASHIPDENTLNTYKSYYLAMRSFFDSHPEKLFVVMSTPPLHRLDTNATEGYYARAFADWLKSNEYVAGHTNTVCFDLFGYLAGSDNFLSYNYESSHGGSDSHPNLLADQTVGPIFAGFLIAAAAAYQSSTSSVAAPANVAASKGTYYDKVRITWDAVGDSAAYRVYRNEILDSSSAEMIASTTDAYLNDRTAEIGGLYYYWVKTQATNDSLSLFSQPDSGWRRDTPATGNAGRDLDGDGAMDPVVYCAANGNWDALLSSTGYEHARTTMGGPGYQAMTGDYDGDRRADLVTYDDSVSVFIVALSGLDYQSIRVAMEGEGVLPESGDYDGDGLADPVLYSRSSGTWRARLSTAGYDAVEVAFGGPQYRAVPADYDGDGKTDPAVCDEQAGLWIVMSSANDYARVSVYFGSGNGTSVPADYDGDGLADPSVYHAETGLWEAWYSGAGQMLVSYSDFGESGFMPYPGDYDGDGLADPAIYNPETREWRALFSTREYTQVDAILGETDSVPVGVSP